MKDRELFTYAEKLLVTLINFSISQLGKCGGKCRGWDENSPGDLCDKCLAALIENRDLAKQDPEVRKLFNKLNEMNAADKEKFMNILEQVVNFKLADFSDNQTH